MAGEFPAKFEDTGGYIDGLIDDDRLITYSWMMVDPVRFYPSDKMVAQLFKIDS